MVARRYFEAINDRDLDGAVAMWAAGGREHVRGVIDAPAPEGVRQLIGEMLHAMPDMRFELLDTTTEGERCGVRWRLHGTFAGPGSWNGIAPTGHKVTLEGLPSPQRQVHRILHRIAWDGGPVKIAGTLVEGDQVAGFTVVHLPGHAPGQIGLWRESDRLALVSDCFYTLDMWGRHGPPHLPEDVYNFDTDQARESLLKLAALEPAAAWPGHAKPVVGDVRSQLQAAAQES
jgi:predicted ester cyclase